MANYPELTPVPDPPEDEYEWRSNSTGIDFYLPTVASLADVPKSLAYFAESINKYEIENADGYLPTDGMQPMEGNLNLDGFKAINAADPEDAQDVATRNYVDLADAAKADIAGDDFTGEVTVVSPVGDSSVGARNIYLSAADPVDEGADGDIWVKYIP